MPLKILGDLDNFRDFVHIDDACNAILNTIDTGYTWLLNIGAGRNFSIRIIEQNKNENQWIN
jgi:nucleoside-diphosphate-sugar epimerase